MNDLLVNALGKEDSPKVCLTLIRYSLSNLVLRIVFN